MTNPLHANPRLIGGLFVILMSFSAGCAPPQADKPVATAAASEVAPAGTHVAEKPAPQGEPEPAGAKDIQAASAATEAAQTDAADVKPADGAASQIESTVTQIADDKTADPEAPKKAQTPPPVKRQTPAVKVPAYVVKTLAYIDKYHRAPSGYEGGRIYHNYGSSGEQTLPRNDARGNKVSYREWDVHPHRLGLNRGPERLVTGTDGSAYFTANHYRTFTKIR